MIDFEHMDTRLALGLSVSLPLKSLIPPSPCVCMWGTPVGGFMSECMQFPGKVKRLTSTSSVQEGPEQRT
jgi:hypothetical protein